MKIKKTEETSKKTMIDDNYSINYHYIPKEEDGEIILFVNMNLLHEKNTSFIKHVGWFQLTYPDEVSLPNLSFSIDLHVPHPKLDQDLVSAAFKSLNLASAAIETFKDIPLLNIRKKFDLLS